jgi:hypothetical protein
MLELLTWSDANVQKELRTEVATGLRERPKETSVWIKRMLRLAARERRTCEMISAMIPLTRSTRHTALTRCGFPPSEGARTPPRLAAIEAARTR